MGEIKMKKKIMLLSVFVLVATLTACGNPKLKNGEEVVAQVDGYKISANDLYKEMKLSYGYSKAINMIDSYIAKQEVKDDDDLEKRVNEIFESYNKYASSIGMDLKTFVKYYLSMDIEDSDEFKDIIKEQYRLELAVNRHIQDSVSDEEVENYYNERYSEVLTVKHILIKPASEEDEENARQIAVSVIDKLNETSADELDSKFNELALTYSADSSYNNGGLIENFMANDVVKEFYQASTELNDGEYTKEPVKTQYGYHVILKVSEKDKKELKDVKDEIKEKIADDIINNDTNARAKALNELREKYNIKIYDNDIKKVYDEQKEI